MRARTVVNQQGPANTIIPVFGKKRAFIVRSTSKETRPAKRQETKLKSLFPIRVLGPDLKV